MKKISKFFYLFAGFYLALPTLVRADDCELLSQLSDSTGRFCCKTEGVVERVCSNEITESCQFNGAPGIIRHCDLKVTPLEQVLDHAVHTVEQTNEYSVNLMWINASLDPAQEYIYPAQSEDEFRKGLLDQVEKWAACTSGGSIILWYDSLLTPRAGVENTKRVLEHDASQRPEWAAIQLRDIRDFQEVIENPEVFSDKTPVYFRADLLRVLAAYHSLREANESGKRHHLAYADLDVAPLSKELLFDAKTKRKLDEFGIVMAHGGLNDYQFENSFQMFSSDKPNLLKAMKSGLIDINISRANNILQGGNWEYRTEGDTRPLEQQVFNSYDAMFHYYYHLQGWGVAHNWGSPVDFNHGEEVIFGLQELHKLYLKMLDPKVKVEKDKFGPSGKITRVNKLKIPRKVIDAPASRFGGAPTQFDPDKISVKNFTQKLTETLDGNGKLDNPLLYIIARNNFVMEAALIAEKRSPEALTVAVTTKNTKYSDEGLTPIDAALEEGHSEIVQIILEKISEQPELLDQVAETLVTPIGVTHETSLYRFAKKKNMQLFRVLVKQFVDHPKVLSLIGQILIGMEEVDLDLFHLIIEKAPEMLAERKSDLETFAIKAVKRGHFDILKWVAEKAPETLEQKNRDGDFPLLLATKGADVETFKYLWERSKKMQTEANYQGQTIAHKAAEQGRLEIIRIIANEAPQLFNLQDTRGSIPTHEATYRQSAEVLKFLVDNFPETLGFKNRWGWTPAATAAKNENTEGLDYITSKYPDIVLSEFSSVLGNAMRSSESLIFLAKKFPDKLSTIIDEAKRRRFRPEEIVAELEKLKTSP